MINLRLTFFYFQAKDLTGSSTRVNGTTIKNMVIIVSCHLVPLFWLGNIFNAK